MARTLASNADNDLVLDPQGRLLILEGQAAVAANCRSAIQAQRGEMVLAVDRGMPTFGTAWNGYRPGQFEAAARVILRDVPGVLSVDAFTVGREGDRLVYAATIRTVYGEAALNGGL